MKAKIRFVALFTVLALLFAVQICVFADDGVLTVTVETTEQLTEQNPEQAQSQVDISADQPAAWAFDGVNWSAIYGLADPSLFSKYDSSITITELYNVANNIFYKIAGKAFNPSEDIVRALANESEKAANRGEAVVMLFETLKTANVGTAAVSQNPVEYFVSTGLLKGRQQGQLDLDKPCSRQELLVFAWRVYEFAAYETGNDSKGLLWKASDEDSSVYLLGSIHFADPSIYPLSKKNT